MKKKGLTRKEFLKVSAAGAAAVVVSTVIPGATTAAGASTPRWVIVIDLDRCIGCKGCAVACKSEFDTRLGVFRSQVIYRDHGKFPSAMRDFLPWLCNHCEKPTCVKVCPVAPIDARFNGVKFRKRATYSRPDGVVLVDQDRCIGCGLCIRHCPYQVRSFDPGRRAGGNPTKNPADKCTFCEHRVEKGVVPSCVNTCQGRARIFGDINDPESEVSGLLKKHKTKVLLPGQNTEPRVYYIGKKAETIDEALQKGLDIRAEADSIHQKKEWEKGPFA